MLTECMEAVVQNSHAPRGIPLKILLDEQGWNSERANCLTARQWRQQWWWQGWAQTLNYTDLGNVVCKVLRAESTNTTAFWDVTSCSLVEKYQTSAETYCLYHSPALEKEVQSFKMVYISTTLHGVTCPISMLKLILSIRTYFYSLKVLLWNYKSTKVILPINPSACNEITLKMT